MPKKLIKRYMPDHKEIREHRWLQCFGRLLHDPNIWHLNRRSVPGAFSVGLFCAFLPIPFQMLLAAPAAILFRVNLPIAVGLVWITNPITVPPIFYFSYKIGAWVLQIPTRENVSFEFSIEWLTTELGSIWEPLLLGSILLSTASAILGNIAIRLLWRLHIVQYLKQRRVRRKKRIK